MATYTKNPKIMEYFKFRKSITTHAFIDTIKNVPGIEFTTPHLGQQQVIDAYEERLPPTEEAKELGLDFIYKYSILTVACGRRWGKSVISSVIAAQELMVPGARVLLVSYRLDNCEIIFKKVYSIIKALGIKMVVERYRDMELELENGSSIKIASNDNVESKLGDSLSLLVIDEARLFDRELLEMILLPMTLDFQPLSRVLLVSSPAIGYFEQYYRYGQSDDPKYRKYYSINSPTHLNPAIPRDALKEMEETMTPKTYRQEVLGEFVSSDGCVYTEFDKKTCTFTDAEFPRWREYLGNGYVTVNSIDSGFAHYFSSVWFVDVEELDTIMVFAEYFKNKTVTPVHAENLHQIEEDLGVETSLRFADPAAAQQIADLAEYGLYYNKSEKNLRETINFVNTLFMQKSEVTQRPKLLIHENCKELLRELEFVCWKTGLDQQTKEQSNAGTKPFEKDSELKTDWDAQDALRYGIFSYCKTNNIGMSSFDTVIEDQEQHSYEAYMASIGYFKLG